GDRGARPASRRRAGHYGLARRAAEGLHRPEPGVRDRGRPARVLAGAAGRGLRLRLGRPGRRRIRQRRLFRTSACRRPELPRLPNGLPSGGVANAIHLDFSSMRYIVREGEWIAPEELPCRAGPWTHRRAWTSTT